MVSRTMLQRLRMVSIALVLAVVGIATVEADASPRVALNTPRAVLAAYEHELAGVQQEVARLRAALEVNQPQASATGATAALSAFIELETQMGMENAEAGDRMGPDEVLVESASESGHTESRRWFRPAPAPWRPPPPPPRPAPVWRPPPPPRPVWRPARVHRPAFHRHVHRAIVHHRPHHHHHHRSAVHRVHRHHVRRHHHHHRRHHRRSRVHRRRHHRRRRKLGRAIRRIFGRRRHRRRRHRRHHRRHRRRHRHHRRKHRRHRRKHRKFRKAIRKLFHRPRRGHHKRRHHHRRHKIHRQHKRKSAINHAGNRQYVESLYRGLLCRGSDPGGLSFWTNALATGQTRAQVRQGFLGSAEYKGRGGRPCPKHSRASDINYVESLYKSLLCRHSEPAGLNGWVNALQSGAQDRATVRQGFLNSPEFRGRGGKPCPAHSRSSDERYVEMLYNTLLCRRSEAAGKAGWVNALQSGAQTRAVVRQGFLNSPEYKGRGGRPCGEDAPKPPKKPRIDTAGNTRYVENLYRTLLCRASDPAGLAGWVNALANGQSKQTVRDGFLNSAEYKGRGGRPCPQHSRASDLMYVESLYNSLLCRKSDVNGLNSWVNALQRGENTRDQTRQGFLNSAEYKQRDGRPCGAHPPRPPPPPPPKPFDITTSPNGYKNPRITDWGYAHDRQWLDACGGDVKSDYGRWVGNHPNVWYSIALRDCPQQYTGRGEFIIKDGVVKRGPNFRSCHCKPPEPPVKKVWTPPPNAPWRAPPVKQEHFPDIKHARASIGSAAELHCHTGEHINVKDASWGAGQGIWQPSGFINKGSCHAASSLARVTEKCSDKTTCTLLAANAEFGGDPCSDAPKKEILVTYSCVKFKVVPPAKPVPPAQTQTPYPGIRMSVTDEGKDSFLTCPGGNIINILDASYGAHQGFYASNGFISKDAKCDAPDSVTVVKNQCHGKEQCTVKVEKSRFAHSDSCQATHLKLKTTYRCDKVAAPFVPPAPPAPRVYTKVVRTPEVVRPQPAKLSQVDQPNASGVVNIGGSEVHIHVTQLSAPEPNAKALNTVETHLDKLHDTAMNQIENILDDIEFHRKEKKPCLKKLQATIGKFKEAFVKETQNIEKLTHKYSYADDAPTLV